MELIKWATEIRMRAVRRLGQLMQAQREAGLMARAGRPQNEIGSAVDPISDDEPTTLAEAGIDKHLADEARRAGVQRKNNCG